ncbi:DUF1624 domain-containing protein [Rhodobacteraceae bacterium RKSG542]|uniref:DUF1624 domain-containing protein n=1 Tax=Pseudovibrio flavus TaxID=2529854 RepID=UPI0012BBDC34|nr:heparan-alpha-glucosaminide N-acetyltransferase [Pseudovibrio flavus]MTI19054.1 DUF1624 domain-containing protein [Pseudovibrio flavus]
MQKNSSKRHLIYIDIARGVALVAMAIYHFSWDLSWFRLVDWPVSNGNGWRLFAQLIASSFLFLVGFSLVLAHGEGMRWRAFWKREAIIVAAAALVSFVTYFSFGDGMVRFGILHAIAVTSLLAIPFIRAPLWVAVVAIIVMGIGGQAAQQVSPSAWYDWIGIGPSARSSVDFVPVIPWFGAVMLGLVTARLMKASDRLTILAGGAGASLWQSGLAWAGRHSLPIYLLHQPILFGLVWAFVQTGVVLSPQERQFVNECTAVCSQSASKEVCEAVCTCSLDGIKASGTWQRYTKGVPASELNNEILEVYRMCQRPAENR